MAQIVTYDELRSFTRSAINERMILNRDSYVQTHAKTARAFDTFLSHSTKDDELLSGVVLVLENHGATVYTDDRDNRLPSTPNPETAKLLRNQIQNSKRFVVFVTKNSTESRWIPWELGIGDGVLTNDHVALFPAGEYSYESSWAEQEYLGLYQRIVHGRMTGIEHNTWMVLDHTKNSAYTLSRWLRGY